MPWSKRKEPQPACRVSSRLIAKEAARQAPAMEEGTNEGKQERCPQTGSKKRVSHREDPTKPTSSRVDAFGDQQAAEETTDGAAKQVPRQSVTPERRRSLPDLRGSVLLTGERGPIQPRDSGIDDQTLVRGRSFSVSLVRTPVDDEFLGDLLVGDIGWTESASKPRADSFRSVRTASNTEQGNVDNKDVINTNQRADSISPEVRNEYQGNQEASAGPSTEWWETIYDDVELISEEREPARFVAFRRGAEDTSGDWETESEQGGDQDNQAEVSDDLSESNSTPGSRPPTREGNQNNTTGLNDDVSGNGDESNSTPGSPLPPEDSQSGSSEEEMARPATRKFERPPTFSGLGEEDVVDWVARYEKTAKYNGWNDADMKDNLIMYLKGSEEKWWDSLAVEPTGWTDAQVTRQVNNVDLTETVKQARTRLLETFRKGNHAQFQEGKLRNRKQQPGESATEYYYDVISLCRVADPTMGEQAKINYLMGGVEHRVDYKNVRDEDQLVSRILGSSQTGR